jgi:hypothetical protein
VPEKHSVGRATALREIFANLSARCPVTVTLVAYIGNRAGKPTFGNAGRGAVVRGVSFSMYNG